MVPIFVTVVILILGLLFFFKIRKSKFVDNLAHDIDGDEPKTKEVIKEIVDAELSLKSTAKQKRVEIKSLEKDEREIGDYLDKRKGK